MALALAIRRQEHTAAELRRIAGKSNDSAQVRRLLAVAMVLDGHSRTGAAEQNGMERQTLRDWGHRYNEAGISGLMSRKSPGRAPALEATQRAELRQLVIDGPDPEHDEVVR